MVRTHLVWQEKREPIPDASRTSDIALENIINAQDAFFLWQASGTNNIPEIIGPCSARPVDNIHPGRRIVVPSGIRTGLGSSPTFAGHNPPLKDFCADGRQTEGHRLGIIRELQGSVLRANVRNHHVPDNARQFNVGDYSTTRLRDNHGQPSGHVPFWRPNVGVATSATP